MSRKCEHEKSNSERTECRKEIVYVKGKKGQTGPQGQVTLDVMDVQGIMEVMDVLELMPIQYRLLNFY